MLNMCTKCGYVQRELVCLLLPTSSVNNNNNTFYLNFSLWMIFPQSFSTLSQFAFNFYVLSKMCSKWHPRRWRHTCIRRAKLSMIYTSASSQWYPNLHRYCHIAHSPDLNAPDIYLWGVSQGYCVWERSSNNWWTDQISSNLVDLNFSLWMIFPQSFSHLSQFA
jgi:hypothetical protein